MIAIDKNVPLPPPKRGPEATFPWQSMEVGDSFLVEGRSQSSVASHGSLAGQRYGRKFTTRKEGDGVRVWRIA
jgi:hypothetical protein